MNKKVLIIDDEVDLCLVMDRILSRKNYDVECAYCLVDGLKKLHDSPHDSLLLDNNLPDGLGWLQAAAIQREYPALHITLISANRAFPYAAPDGFNRVEKPLSFLMLEQYL